MKLPRDLTLQTGAGLRIGPYLVDASTQRLLRAADRAPVAMDRSSFDLLLALARQPGEVVDKETLLRAVWPRRVVSENSLAQAVRKLRGAIGDTEGELVQLVRGFGYRLALPVERLAEEPATASAEAVASPVHGAGAAANEPMPAAAPTAASPPAMHPPAVRRPARVRAFWSGAAAALLLAGTSVAVIAWRDVPDVRGTPTTERRQVRELRNTLAVLPFVDRSPNGTLAREARALGDRLRKDCHRIPQLTVVGDAEVAAFGGAPEDAEAVLAQLDADLVLVGELQPHPAGVEVSLRLIDHSGQGIGFEQRVAHPLDDLGALRQQLRFDLYRRIGDTPGRWAYDAELGRGTRNPEARLAFLRAATLLGEDEESQRRVKAALELAVELDPNYADAWMALGDVLGAGGGPGGLYADDGEELAEGRRRALAAYDRGISLAPRVPAHYLVRSEIRHLYHHDWAGADADLDQAERLMARPTAHLYIQRARMAAARGDLRTAIEFDERASALDPESGSRRNQGWHHIALGEYAQARALLLAELQVRPFESSLNYYLGLCDLLEDLPEAALARFEHASTVHRLVGTVLAHARRGDLAAAERALASLEQRFADTAAYEIAIGHAWLDRSERAFDWLERAIRVGDGGIMYLAFDPLLAPLRGHPRHDALLRRIRHPSVTAG